MLHFHTDYFPLSLFSRQVTPFVTTLHGGWTFRTSALPDGCSKPRRGWPPSGRSAMLTPVTRCAEAAWTSALTRYTLISCSAFLRPRMTLVTPDGPVGSMAYHGSNDDRREADAIYASYVANVTRFVRWLVDNGRKVRLLIGDANGSDDGTVQEYGRPTDTAAGSRVMAGRRGTSALAGGRDARVGDGQHGGRNALPQRRVRPPALQADHLARILCETRSPDGRHGGAGVLPVG